MKGQYTAYDFISSDLIISDIINVYWTEVANWFRPNPVPRSMNGLVLVTGGRIDYVFGGEKITGSRGDVLLFPKGIPYSGIKQGDAPNSYYVLDFETGREDDCVGFPLPLSFHASDYKSVENGFRSVLRQWNSKDAASRLKCRAEIYILLALLIEDYVKGGSEKYELGAFPKIADYIGRNFTDPQLNVKRICETFYVSESQLRRVFHKSLAQPPLLYIQSMRLGLAKSMLSGENGNVPMEEVAYQCGFTSLSYFSRLFKKHTGVAPSKYQKLRTGSTSPA